MKSNSHRYRYNLCVSLMELSASDSQARTEAFNSRVFLLVLLPSEPRDRATNQVRFRLICEIAIGRSKAWTFRSLPVSMKEVGHPKALLPPVFSKSQITPEKSLN